MYRALKPGGTLAGIVYSTPEHNEFFSIPVGIIRRRANLPAARSRTAGSVQPRSGRRRSRPHSSRRASGRPGAQFHAPLRMDSAADCVRFERESFGALHQMLAGLDDAGREEAWDEIEPELRASKAPNGFAGPCELIVAAAVK